MATIKRGKHAREEDRLLLTQILTTIDSNNMKHELTVKLWDTQLERMETIKFTTEETERLTTRLVEAQK